MSPGIPYVHRYEPRDTLCAPLWAQGVPQGVDNQGVPQGVDNQGVPTVVSPGCTYGSIPRVV